MRALALLLVCAAPAFAQEVAPDRPQVDCLSEALTQAELNACASDTYDAADAELNEAYRLAITAAKAADQRRAVEGRALDVTQEGLLREAQRAWITFRDAACAAEAMDMAGGTAQPMVGTLCLARVTLSRTEDLRLIGSGAVGNP